MYGIPFSYLANGVLYSVSLSQQEPIFPVFWFVYELFNYILITKVNANFADKGILLDDKHKNQIGWCCIVYDISTIHLSSEQTTAYHLSLHTNT